jgi:hypothetical protein
MSPKRYRVTEPTFAMFGEYGHLDAHPIPQGTIILVKGPLEGDGLMDVVWGGKHVMMFKQDLRSRAMPAPEHSKLLPSGLTSALSAGKFKFAHHCCRLRLTS